MEPNKIAANRPVGLKPGDTIGIVAPAGPYDLEQFEQGITVINSLGYEVNIPEELGQSDGFLAGTDKHRASVINYFFAEKNVQGIICARGGYGSMRILDLLDYEMIRNHPKVFIGFSDITALIVSFYSRSNMVCFHGPVVTSLSRVAKETLRAMSAAVSGVDPIVLMAEKAEVISPGRASGVLYGGNLSTLCHLTGTPYAPKFKECILMLEEINEAPYRIDRMLFQMKLAGCFKGVRGIALGSFDNCGDRGDVLKVFKRIFESFAIPVIAGFNIGHGPVNLTVPIGIRATIDSDRCTLNFAEPATRSR